MINILTRRWNNSGFTLLEVIISMALISIALLAVLRLQAMNMDLQAEAEFITTANYLAQDRISRIQCEERLSTGTASGDFGEDFPDFDYREEIIKIPDTEFLFKVIVQILRHEETFSRDLSVETYLFRKPKEDS